MAKPMNFSITTNPAAIISKVLEVIIFGDVVFAILLYLIVLLRDTLEVDGTFSFLALMLFIAKVALTVMAVSKMLNHWLNTQYYVINNELYIGNKHTGELTIRSLKDISAAKVEKGFLGEKFEFGNVTLSQYKGGVKNQIVLHDVDNPQRIAQLLKSVSKRN